MGGRRGGGGFRPAVRLVWNQVLLEFCWPCWQDVRDCEIMTAWLHYITLVELGLETNGTTVIPFYGCGNDGKAERLVLLQEEKRWFEKGNTTGWMKVVLKASCSRFPVFLSSVLALTLRYLAFLSVWIKPFWLTPWLNWSPPPTAVGSGGGVGDSERETDKREWWHHGWILQSCVRVLQQQQQRRLRLIHALSYTQFAHSSGIPCSLGKGEGNVWGRRAADPCLDSSFAAASGSGHPSTKPFADRTSNSLHSKYNLTETPAGEEKPRTQGLILLFWSGDI